MDVTSAERSDPGPRLSQSSPATPRSSRFDRARLSVLFLLAGFWFAAAEAQDSTAERPPPLERIVKSPPAAIDPPQGAGHGSAAVQVGYYDNADSGDGNPFLDESLTVIEPVLMFTYNISDRTSIWSTVSYDIVSSASIDRLSNFEQQSGASGDTYLGFDLGVQYKLTDDVRAGGFVSYSTEYDYNSLGIGADLAVDLFQKNTTLKSSLNAYFDDVDVIRFDGSSEGNDQRTSFAATISWYQVLNSRLHGEVGATVGSQSGFLETPYNSVVIEDPTLPPNPLLDNNARGREITEELPDTRTRLALFGRLRGLVHPRYSLEIGGRVYSDSWGINSLTLEPRIYYWLKPDVTRLRLRYRYYTQTEADDFDDHFFEETPERTQDSDLGGFDSHTLGLGVLWFLSDRWSLEVSGDYVKRDDGLDQILFLTAFQYSF